MTLTLNAAAARLNREMAQSEATIAEALIAATSLMHTAALAGKEFPEAPAVTAQSALIHLTKLVSGLLDARAEALRVHGKMLEISREMGATETPYCPDANPFETGEQLAA